MIINSNYVHRNFVADEDGDYINMYNDQDWKLAIEKGLPKKIIKLHVDCISEE